MKSFKHTIIGLLGLLSTSAFSQQYKDTIITVQDRKLDYEYDIRWSKEKVYEGIASFRKNQTSAPFKSSDQISQILQQIKVSQDACDNGGFEDDYAGWTGLSLKHGITTLPIENGLIVNPGIAPLPFTGVSFGENYTSIETTGTDAILASAVPAFTLSRTAPGTTGSKSLRLGNDQPGYGAEGVAKRFLVTPSNAKYYFQYAMVMDKSHSNADGSMNGSEVFFAAEAVTLSGATVDKIIDVANPSNPFINQTNSTTPGDSGIKYYRDWRCAYLDLSSQIGNEVVVMFINSDCSAGGHNGYTYIDDVCKSCVNKNEGDINLELKGKDCIEKSQTYGGTFTIPDGATNINIQLDIYQSNAVVSSLTTPTISGSSYSFTVNASDFPDQTPGTCYDLVSILTFDLIDLNGNLQTVTQYSSKPVGGVQDGEVTGINNDVCFCENNKGAYCCDAENLVENANFEAGDTGFTSDYTQTAITFPGQYNVTTTAAAFGATITDHSFCEDSVAYATNDKFMVVNGKTQQAGTSAVWEQTVTGLRKGERYKFCANFKNMPQCTFDILPQVEATAGASSSGLVTVNTTVSDPCDWQLIGFEFTATGTSETISINLLETGNGDGNDLAIDDIYVGQLGDPLLQITVQHDGTTSGIEASLNTITNTDDVLHGDCTDYHWYVAEVTSFPGIVIDWSTFAHGNNTGSNLPPFAGTPSATNWNLTTTFPGYTFDDNKLYIIGMYTPACGCYDSSFTYQLTFNAKSASMQGLTPEQKEEVIDAILNGLDIEIEVIEVQEEADIKEFKLLERVSLFPNPTADELHVALENDTITSVQITDLSGNSVFLNNYKGDVSTEVIDVTSLMPGIYFVNTMGISRIYSSKFIKK